MSTHTGTGVSTAKGGGQSWDRYWMTRFPSNSNAVIKSDTEIDLMWDNNGTADYTGHKIYLSTDGGINYALKDTIVSIGTSHSLTGLNPGTAYQIKIVAYKGTRESQSSICASRTYPDLHDGKVVGWFKPTRADGVIRDAEGRESVYWDMIYGNNTLGEEQDSGDIVVYGVYKITACQANFFYNGCAVGDTFACAVVKTCDANNKVQRYVGNHLSHNAADITKLPVNRVFAGDDDSLISAPIPGLIQPETVYLVFKQKSWTLNDGIYDGTVENRGALYQAPVTPRLRINAGSASADMPDIAINEKAILTNIYNGNASYMRKGLAVAVGPFAVGSNNMGQIALGFSGSGVGNFEFYEAVFKSGAVDDATYQENMVRALAEANSISIGAAPEIMLGIQFDDASEQLYTGIFELFKTFPGFAFSLGLRKDWMEEGLYDITTAQVLEMQAAGHEFMSHSATHPDLSTLGLSQLQAELIDSKTYLTSIGVNCYGIIYPQCGYNDLVIEETLKNYEYGYTCNTIATGKQTFPAYLGKLKRVNLSNSIPELKAFIDSVIADNGASIGVMWCHAMDYEQSSIDKLPEILAYIQSKGLTTKTPKYMIDKIKTYIPSVVING